MSTVLITNILASCLSLFILHIINSNFNNPCPFIYLFDNMQDILKSFTSSLIYSNGLEFALKKVLKIPRQVSHKSNLFIWNKLCSISRNILLKSWCGESQKGQMIQFMQTIKLWIFWIALAEIKWIQWVIITGDTFIECYIYPTVPILHLAQAKDCRLWVINRWVHSIQSILAHIDS